LGGRQPDEEDGDEGRAKSRPGLRDQRAEVPSQGFQLSMIGRTISHYLILEQIGAGGMGVVYRAHDERLDRDVALKVLSPELADDQEFTDRFRREARTLSKLNHPNVSRLYTTSILKPAPASLSWSSSTGQAC
jgi:serine/threonine protein kinase